MDGREVWRLELRKLSLWETCPSGGVINLGLLFDLTPLGPPSSNFLDPLIGLLVKTLWNQLFLLSFLCFASPHSPRKWTHKQHNNASVTHSDVFCSHSCLMRHQGLSSWYIKWEMDTHICYTIHIFTLSTSICCSFPCCHYSCSQP